jgi:hypothetical protein
VEPSTSQFAPVDKEAMTKQLQAESADYKASQPAERNGGYLHSGVNQFVRGSSPSLPEPDTSGTRWTYTGPKDPYKI